MKVYIAGKITGDPEYRTKFRLVEEKLLNQGDIVLNPASLPEGMGTADYMRICFAMIDTADVCVFLPDWEESRGARFERAYEETDYIAARGASVGRHAYRLHNPRGAKSEPQHERRR